VAARPEIKTNEDSSRPHLDADCAVASLAIVEVAEEYGSRRPGNVQDGMNAKLRHLNPDQLTEVLKASGKRCLIVLLKTANGSGARDLVDLFFEFIQQGRFRGDALKLFGGVVPECFDSKPTTAMNLLTFVSQITSSNAVDLMQKDLIIWGTHAADPTLAVDGHWARAARINDHSAQAALLSGVAKGLMRDASAARLLPPSATMHAHALDQYATGLAEAGPFRSLLRPLQMYLRQAAQEPAESPDCALL
jgi:hypothetical protein